MLISRAITDDSLAPPQLPVAKHFERVGTKLGTPNWQLAELSGIEGRRSRDAFTATDHSFYFHFGGAVFVGDYCNFPYSALACFRMGMSESASFHNARKSW